MANQAQAMAPGMEKENALRDGGFSDQEIDNWKSETAQHLQDGGFSAQEIRDYFGQKTPNMAAAKAEVKKNLEAPKTEGAVTSREPIDAGPKPIEAKDVWDAMAAGWGNSVLGLMSDGGESPIQLGSNAGVAQTIASGAAQMVGDAPAMAAGFLGGGAAGGTAGTATLPVVGTISGAAVGAAAGAFGVPQAMRKILIDHYQKGDIQDAGDFARRVVGTTWEGAKGAITGAATAITGGIAGPLAGTAARMASEVAAQTVVSNALEGRLPDKRDFINGAVLIGGLHAVGFGASKGTGYVAEKLQNIYAKTGAPPSEVIEAASTDPHLKGELLSENPELPKEAKALAVRDEAQPPGAPAESEEQLKPGKSAARDELLSRIGEEKEPAKQSLGEKIEDNFNRLYAKTLDKTKVIGDVLKEVGKDDINDKNAQVLMRLHAAVQDKIQGFVENETRDWEGKPNGESLMNILNEYKEKTGDTELSDLKAYGIASRTIELAGRGIKQPGSENAMDVNGVEREFIKNNPQVQPFFDRLVAFKNRTLDYLGSSGRYSDEQVTAMKDLNKRYISFRKILEPDPLTGEMPSSTKAIKKIGNSDLLLRDPIESTLRDVGNMIKLAHETEAKNAFVEAMLGKQPVADSPINELNGRVVEPITDPRFLLSGEYEAETPQDENPFIRKAESQSGAPKDWQIEGWQDGKRTLYDTTPEIAEALKSMAGNRPALSMWTGLLKPFAAGLRIGTVNNPLFGIRHAWRNQLSAATLSQTGLKPFEALLYAPEFLTKGDSYRDFIHDGGAVQTIMPLDKDYLDGKIYELDKDAPFLGKAWNVVKQVGALSHWGIALNDNMIRFAEYKRMLDSDATRKEAAFAAREVLPDYQKTGLQKSALTQITAFLNVHAQGMARMVQETTNNPAGYVAKNLAYITVPSLLLYAAQSDDDAIKDLPDWQKYNYWNIHVSNWRDANSLAEAMSVKNAYPSNARQMPDGSWQVNDGTIVRIQKPFTNGILFGSAFDATLDAWRKKDPEAFGSFIKTVGGSTIAEPIPTALTPVLEQAANRNFYTGQALVRQSMENKLPEMQYDAYTSDTAKILGKLVSYVPLARDIGPKDATLASPKVIDNYIHGWTGTMGYYAIDALDKGLEKAGITPERIKPTATLADIPFVKEFVVRFPNAHPQSVSDFEDRYRKADQVSNSIKMLLKQGDVQGATDLQDRYHLNMDKLHGVDEAIRNLNAAIQKVNQTPDIDPVQKRQLIDGMMYQMTSVAKAGNLVMDEFEKSAKNKKAGN